MIIGRALKSIVFCSGWKLLIGYSSIPVFIGFILCLGVLFHLSYKLSPEPSPYSKVWFLILGLGFFWGSQLEWPRYSAICLYL